MNIETDRFEAAGYEQVRDYLQNEDRCMDIHVRVDAPFQEVVTIHPPKALDLAEKAREQGLTVTLAKIITNSSAGVLLEFHKHWNPDLERILEEAARR